MQSVPVTPAAAEGLRARTLAVARAQSSFSDFLAGVVLAMEIDPAKVVGFDDETGAIVLREDEGESEDAPA